MGIKEEVFEQLDRGRICVFPTEASRRFYLEAYAADPRRGMVFESQTMAWDSFQQLFLQWDRSLAPSSPWIRRLFATLFVSSDEAGALRHFALGGGALTRDGLANHLASILPRIPLAVERAEGDLKADLVIIGAAYSRFLAQRGLCETLWVEPKVPEGLRPGDYAICFPEAIEGFWLFCRYVDRSLFSYIGGGQVEGRLEVYPNTVAELKAQLRRIRALLDSGIPMSDIVISCAGLEGVRPYLEREARLKGVELDIKEGRRLTSYPAGRLFLDLRTVAAEDYSLGSMESLLLNPSYPWKEPGALRALVEKGIFGQAAGGREDWLARLRGGKGEEAEPRSLFLKLHSLVEAFGRCRTVEALRRALNGFQDEFFAPGAFEGAGDEERDVYAYCVRQLDELEKAMAVCRVDALPDLFGFYVKALSTTRYAPRKGGGGVAVYRYSQGAGLCPPHHFILNIGARSVRAKRVCLGFLPAFDATDPLITGFDDTEPLLALASRSGTNVHLSGPVTGVEGAVLCPVSFLEGGRRRLMGPPESPDEYKMELSYWAGAGGRFRPNQLQKDSFLAFREAGTAPGASGGPLPGPRRGGLSARRLDDYLRCPFLWFCVHVLGVENDNPFVPPSEDPRASGNLVHAALERLLAESCPTTPARAASYRARLLELLDEELPRFKAANPMGDAVWLHVRRKIRRQIEEGLDLGPLEGFGFVAKEKSLSETEGALALEGRVDLVLALPGGEGLGVLDIKSGSLKSRKARIGIQDWEANGLDSVQLLVYARLLAASGEGFPVWSAYYSLKDDRFYIGWEPGSLEKEKVDRELDEKIAQVSRGVEEGLYRPTPGEEACERCALFPVCRARYVVR